MLYLFIILFAFIYILAALITIKLEYVFLMQPTEYWPTLILSFLFWIPIAILYLSTKHMTGYLQYYKSNNRVVAEIKDEQYHF